MKPNLKAYLSYILLAIIVIAQSCKPSPNIVKHNGEKDLISFRSVFGVNYTEVSRLTEKGLSFTEFGYQLEPQWRMNFVSNDSVSIFSPTKNMFINFPLTRGYDSIFNTARTWLKIRAMNRDSLKLEILEAYGDTVDTRGAKTFMIFYADGYIKNRLHSDTAALKRPSAKDSLYIYSLAAAANKDYHNAFAARQPVILNSKSPLVRVKKWTAEGDFFNHFDTSEGYMNPTYDIGINKAYADFYYSFTIFIDVNGTMHYGKPLIPFMDESFRDNYIKLSTAIMDRYMRRYLKITVGKTLNIPHASEINVHVAGKTGL